MDTEREALQCTAYPEVQSFCQKHGLAFEVSVCVHLESHATPCLLFAALVLGLKIQNVCLFSEMRCHLAQAGLELIV